MTNQQAYNTAPAPAVPTPDVVMIAKAIARRWKAVDVGNLTPEQTARLGELNSLEMADLSNVMNAYTAAWMEAVKAAASAPEVSDDE